jgi:hypothetical protein
MISMMDILLERPSKPLQPSSSFMETLAMALCNAFRAYIFLPFGFLFMFMPTHLLTMSRLVAKTFKSAPIHFTAPGTYIYKPFLGFYIITILCNEVFTIAIETPVCFSCYLLLVCFCPIW